MRAYAERSSLYTNRPEGMRYLKVGADLSANTAFQTLHLHRMYQLSRTNGTPPGPLPQNRVPSVGYRLFDKRRLAGDLEETGSNTCLCGVSDTTWAAAQPIAAVVTSESSHALRAEAEFSVSSEVRCLIEKHRTVGGGLPAMNDDAIFLTYRVDCIAGKPPPTVRCLLQDRAVSKTSGHLKQPGVCCTF